MTRSAKKGPYVDPKLLKKISRLPAGSREVIKTWSRNGHRLGEFSPTKKFTRHGGKMQRELEQKAEAAASESVAAAKPAK
ncbi:MAG: ribosomal protein S19 family protein [Candidatus Niyogibacteria bacterium]|nr:ribosomal protein S19 family protein [Candidatus Niyogibacteria bacterium]